jgi:hypothetical protein
MKIFNFDYFINENNNDISSTVNKLIKTAEKDGYLIDHESMAGYVLAAAKKVAIEWNKLNIEEQKVFRDHYYDKFLKLIHKK